MRISFTPKKLSLDFTPRVYLRDRTHAYLLIKTGKKWATFLTWGNGLVERVKVHYEDGEYRCYKNNDGEVKEAVARFYHPLVPYLKMDCVELARRMWDSTFSKTPVAERELRAILGMPLGEELPQPTSSLRPKKATPEGFTLAGICVELNMDPTKARKLLRGKVDKPEHGWAWATEAEANEIRVILKGK